MVRQMVADGHEVGNHSVTHPDFRTIDHERIAWELDETERIVQEVSGATTRPFFRPPFGGYDDRVLLSVADRGYLTVFWSLDAQDAIGPPKTADFLVQRVTGTFPSDQAAGTIVLAHCCGNRYPIAEALPAILEQFAAQGVRVCPLSEALGGSGRR
jgi:peptidoglycan-N-acetylmuramic acid deacetylase